MLLNTENLGPFHHGLVFFSSGGMLLCALDPVPEVHRGMQRATSVALCFGSGTSGAPRHAARNILYESSPWECGFGSAALKSAIPLRWE
jgi:hypothetical protein